MPPGYRLGTGSGFSIILRQNDVPPYRWARFSGAAATGSLSVEEGKAVARKLSRLNDDIYASLSGLSAGQGDSAPIGHVSRAPGCMEVTAAKKLIHTGVFSARKRRRRSVSA